MEEVVTAFIYTVLIALIEFTGVAFPKLLVARHIANKELDVRIADAILEAGVFPKDKGPDRAMIIEKCKDIRVKTDREVFRNCLESIAPGPELCFLSGTIGTSLFLIFHYVPVSVRLALSPSYANSHNTVPLLVAGSIISFLLWMMTNVWREGILFGVQERRRRLSSSFILAIGCGCVAVLIYFILAGRWR